MNLGYAIFMTRMITNKDISILALEADIDIDRLRLIEAKQELLTTDELERIAKVYNVPIAIIQVFGVEYRDAKPGKEWVMDLLLQPVKDLCTSIIKKRYNDQKGVNLVDEGDQKIIDGLREAIEATLKQDTIFRQEKYN